MSFIDRLSPSGLFYCPQLTVQMKYYLDIGGLPMATSTSLVYLRKMKKRLEEFMGQPGLIKTRNDQPVAEVAYIPLDDDCPF